MKWWATISKFFPGTQRRSMEAHTRLMAAYRDVFMGTPSREQQQIVLADLHAFCGYTQVSSPEYSDRALWHTEGKRTAYARIHSFLALSHEDVSALEHAARLEAATSQALNDPNI